MTLILTARTKGGAPPITTGYAYLAPQMAIAPTDVSTGLPMTFNEVTGRHNGTTVDTTEPTWASFVDVTDSGNTTTNRTNLQNAIDAAVTNMTQNVCLRLPSTFVWRGTVVLRRKTAAYWLGIRTVDVANLPTLSDGLYYGTKLNRVSWDTHAGYMPEAQCAASTPTLQADSYETQKYYLRGIKFTNPTAATCLNFASVYAAWMHNTPSTVTAATSTVVTLASAISGSNVGNLVYVMKGTGFGQARVIQSISGNDITVSAAFSTTLDSTSRLQVAPRPFGMTSWDYTTFDITKAVPSDVIIAQCLADGAWPTGRVRRAYQFSGRRHAVIDSETRAVGENGADSQDVSVIMGPGPHKYTNCKSSIGGNSENWLSGGGSLYGEDGTFLLYDTEIRGNLCDKPMDVVTGNGHKNHIEVKFGVRVLIEGNVTLNHNMLAQTACFAIKMTDQGGTNAFTQTGDIIVMSNRQFSGPGFGAFTGREGSPNNTNRPFRYEIRNNVGTPSLMVRDGFAQLGSSMDGHVYRWNTWRSVAGQTGYNNAVMSLPANPPPADTKITDVTISDNVFCAPDGISTHYMITAGSSTETTLLAQFAGTSVVSPNLMNCGATNAGYANQIRVAQTMAAIEFVDITNAADLSLAPSSAGKNAGAGGKDMGANWTLIQQIVSEVM